MAALVDADLGGITIPNRGVGDSKQRRNINRYLWVNVRARMSTRPIATYLLPRFKEVQGCWDAREGELTDEQWGIQPRIPFFLGDEPPTFCVQLREGLQL